MSSAEPNFFATVRQAMGVEKPAPATTSYAPAATFQGDIAPYAAEALNREVMAVATAPAGTRNDTLNIAAVKLGSLVAGGNLPPALVLQELTNAATAAGLEPAEIRATLNSGLRKGEQTPREIPDNDRRVNQWLNSIASGQAHRPESANTSTPSQTHLQAPPAAQNGTQPTSPNTPFTGSAPWEQPATGGQSTAATSTTGAPSSYSPAVPTVLPWEKSESSNGNHQTPPPATTAATTITPATTATDPAATPAPGSATADYAYLQPPPEVLNQRIALELLNLQSRAGANRLFNRQNTAATPPQVHSLTEFLLIPDEPVEYRVHGLLPKGGRIIIAAQYKAGKSSMIGNLVKAMVDGKPFLESFAVEKARTVTVIDDELDQGTLRRWFREQNIENTDAVRIVPMRGCLPTFDILDPVTRREWAQRLAGTEILILDCLRPVMDALGLSEDKDAGKFLVAFDALIAECGAAEAVVVHHMGHGGNRSRGDSRILDWPDATWSIKRENPEDPNSPRYFEALGRDVKVSESLLEWDPESRGLRIAGPGRREQRQTDVLEAVVEFVRMHPGISGRALQKARGGSAAANNQALKKAVDLGLLRKSPGRNGGDQYHAAWTQHPPPATDRDYRD